MQARAWLLKNWEYVCSLSVPTHVALHPDCLEYAIAMLIGSACVIQRIPSCRMCCRDPDFLITESLKGCRCVKPPIVS